MLSHTFSGLNFNGRLDSEYNSPWTVPLHFIRACIAAYKEQPGFSTKPQMKRDGIENPPKYFFGWEDGAHFTVAHLFEDEPYLEAIKFLSEHPSISRKAVKGKLGFLDNKPQMTFTLEDPRRIFAAFRLLAKNDISASDIENAYSLTMEGAPHSDDEEEEEEED